MTNPDNVGGLPDGMVMVQRSDAMRLAMFVEPLLTGGAVQLSAMRIAELCRAAPADNAGGLIWYVCTSCMLMVQLPSDTPTLGRCQCSPKGWSLRRAKLPKGYELCRAAPAGGDDVDTLLALVPRPAMAHHKMDEAEEREINRVNRFRDHVISNIRAHCASRPDSAPAGSGEVVVPAIERMLVDAYAAGMNGDNFDMLAARRNLSALLRKLQQGADGEARDGRRWRAVRDSQALEDDAIRLTTWSPHLQEPLYPSPVMADRLADELIASQDQEGWK